MDFNNLNSGNLDAAIEDFLQRSENLKLDSHRMLVAIAADWAASGDCRHAVKRANRIIGAKKETKALRVQGMVNWFATHCGLQLADEGENKGKIYCPADKTSGQHLDLKTLANARWFDETPPPALKPFDFTTQVEKLLKLAATRAEKNDGTTTIDEELLAEIKAAATRATLRALKAKTAEMEAAIEH